MAGRQAGGETGHRWKTIGALCHDRGEGSKLGRPRCTVLGETGGSRMSQKMSAAGLRESPRGPPWPPGRWLGGWWMDRRMDWWVDGQIDRWMDE